MLTIIKMSYISSPNKNSALWKVSGSNRGNNHEQSRLYPTYHLPERFSPSRGGLNNSRLFNSSIEKLKFSKIQTPNERCGTPNKQPILPPSFPSHQSLKDSIQMQRLVAPKSPNSRKTALQTKESCASISSEQIAQIRQQISKEFIHQYQHNRKLIKALKDQFSQFRQTVLSEIAQQKHIIAQAIQEITKKKDRQANNIETIVPMLKNNREIPITQIVERQNKTNQLQTFIEKQKLSNIPIQIGQLPGFSIPITKAATVTACEEKQMILIHPSDEIELHPQLIKLSKPKLSESPKNQIFSETPQSPLQKISSVRPKGDSPDIQKCTQLVQTINILSQLNDCPIERSQSAEKNIIQQCKQKALNSIKSNDNLCKQKMKARQTAREQAKVKGNFKLDKFYSAIQKLKEQVNEIRHISDIKQTKNGRIIKTYQ